MSGGVDFYKGETLLTRFHCPRCFGEHESIARPIIGSAPRAPVPDLGNDTAVGGVVASHWTMCATNAEPVFLSFQLVIQIDGGGAEEDMLRQMIMDVAATTCRRDMEALILAPRVRCEHRLRGGLRCRKDAEHFGRHGAPVRGKRRAR